jgi:hypothetical protein
MGRDVVSAAPDVRAIVAADLLRPPVPFLASFGSFLKKEKTTTRPDMFRLYRSVDFRSRPRGRTAESLSSEKTVPLPVPCRQHCLTWGDPRRL